MGNKESCEKKQVLAVLFHWNMLWTLLMLAGIGIFMMGMPKYLDDYAYMGILRDWFMTQGVIFPEDGGNIIKNGFPWREIADSWSMQYAENNIRLGNLVVTTLLLFPKWVGSGIMAILWGCVMFRTFSFAGIKWQKSPLVPLALAMWTFLLPWNDHFGSLDFQLNYVPATLFSIMLYNLIAKTHDKDSRITGFVVTSVIGLLVGISHEGIAIPCVSGIAGLIILCPDWRMGDKVLRAICGMAGLVTGIVVIMSAPGIRDRMSSQASVSGIFFTLRHILPELLVYILCAIMWLVTILNKSKRALALRPEALLCIISASVSVLAACYAGMGGRALFWGDFMSTAGMLSLLHGLYGFSAGYGRKGVIIVVSVLLTGTYSYWTFMSFRALRFRENMKTMLVNYVANPEKPFCIAKEDGTWPGVLMSRLADRDYPDGCMKYVRTYYRFGEKRLTGDEAVIPGVVAHVTRDSGQLLDGAAKVHELDGWMFVPADNLSIPLTDGADEILMLLDMGNGYKVKRVALHGFVSNDDGQEYYWLEPKISIFISAFTSVRGASFIK